MDSASIFRYAFSLSATLVLLSGCGGSQPSLASPRLIAQNGAHHASSSSGDLLYLSDPRQDGIVIYSYPALKKVVGEINNVGGPVLCSDQHGNVFAVAYVDGEPVVYEFSHGGTQPIATLSLYGDDEPMGCSVDPMTGNLAVTNNDGNNFYNCDSQGNVAIFADAQGQPQTYCTGPAVRYAYECGYDNAGNLYVDGSSTEFGRAATFAELPQGSSTFTAIKLNRHLDNLRAIQWDGSYITIETAGGKTVPKIYAVQVSGTNGRIVRTTAFQHIESATIWGSSWIQGNSVVIPGDRVVDVFPYPAGGKATNGIHRHIGTHPNSVTVSVAPTL